MKIHQVSVFLENKPGQMTGPCRLLAGAGINIRTLTLADTKHFGILRLILSEWQEAVRILSAAGYITNVAEVVAVEVPDRPGGLAEVLAVFDSSEVNIEYMYAFPSGSDSGAVLIFRFNDPDRAIQLLQAAGVNVVGGVAVYNRIET